MFYANQDAEIVHGDLTTSNILIRDKVGNNSLSDIEIVLIDFGLGTYSFNDLYLHYILIIIIS